ncbi:MAG: hypothetical protein O7C70_07485 [Candidatus Dadabacteria bacterium]|nr:hypothetical protein [Candidatus Dadabacteria bacterium]
MNKAKWLFMFLLALSMAAPTFAVELTLGGFPSFMRTRYRLIENATFISALSSTNAQQLGFDDNRDSIFFGDTTLRLTPQLVLSDSVTIRVSLNVFDNNIWGGATSNFFGGGNTIINSGISFSDRFRGAILTGPRAIDDPGFFDVRMLHVDIVLPNNYGFLRIGRQPFDWGLGILANGGWDPYSDLGFELDRFLYLKSFAAGAGSLTFVLVADILSQGNSVVAGQGGGYNPGALAVIFNNPNVGGTNFTLGGYFFPWFFQNNIGNFAPGTVPALGTSPNVPPNAAASVSNVNLDRLSLWSGLFDVKTDRWRLAGEFQAWQGDFQGPLTIDTSWIFAARAEVYPGWPLKIVALEFGWSQGGDGDPDDNAIRGNESGLFFNPAYNIDTLLFKHMLPNIYQTEGSVINAYYARVWTTVKVVDSISFTPQVIVAFNENTDNVVVNGTGVAESIDTYMGTEVEGTITWHIHPGVSFDLIGGVVFTGTGLDQLLNAQAESVLAVNDISPDRVDYDATPWTVQGRLMIFIDQFFK